MSWTEEKVNKLKELWGRGKTASQIAEIIGGISRNAVIGKAHRLNLSAKIKSKNIIVYGESLGTGIATKLSINYSFNMTILEAPFTSIADVAQKRYWIFPAKYLVLDFLYKDFKIKPSDVLISMIFNLVFL